MLYELIAIVRFPPVPRHASGNGLRLTSRSGRAGSPRSKSARLPFPFPSPPRIFPFLRKIYTRPPNLSRHRIAKAAGTLVLAQNGVIRSLANWGTYLLPQPIKKHQTRYDTGHHFVLRFDAPPGTQEAVRRMLGVDPRVLRHGVVKLGKGKLAEGAKYGDVRWTRKPLNGMEQGPSFGLFDIV